MQHWNDHVVTYHGGRFVGGVLVLELSSVTIKREVFYYDNLTNSCSHLSYSCFPFPASNSCAVTKLVLGVIKAWKLISNSVVLLVLLVFSGINLLDKIDLLTNSIDLNIFNNDTDLYFHLWYIYYNINFKFNTNRQFDIRFHDICD